eukprot:GHRQ01030957.1.p1 GENE.GHRQ01030957.1~~GHRQ01030957.1.p1  ORF type:complete len:178 (+),score=62.21 GHRQ01030957.1:67-600(+)
MLRHMHICQRHTSIRLASSVPAPPCLLPPQHLHHSSERPYDRIVPAAAAAAGQSQQQPKRQQPTAVTAPPAEAAELVVGMDLGTTNSAIAYMHDGKPICIPNELGDTLTPSVVAFQPGGSSLVGRAAKQQDPRTTYYSVKRLIGRTWDDPAVQEERSRLAYEVGVHAVRACVHAEGT